MQNKKCFHEIQVICLDFDSTIINHEGIDELARQKECYSEVSEITRQAMEEGLSYKESLEKRLNILKPSMDDIKRYHNKEKIEHFSKGLLNLIEKSKLLNKEIYIISGGFEQLIFQYTDYLNIPRDNIFCNSLIFDDNGNYQNFDTSRLTCESSGKIKVIELIKLKTNNKNIMMIGDGSTDLETQPYVNLFIGYGGNIERVSIKEKIKKLDNSYYYTDFNKLIDELNLVIL